MCRPDPIRVLIADAYPASRHALTIFLQAYDDLTLAAEASSATEAVRICREACPDVVLIDVMEPGGPAAIQAIRESCPSVAIIGISELTQSTATSIRAARQAGADVCLLKGVAGSVLADAIRRTHPTGTRPG
jgi:DNA-binding NarL/FixJ family response regulator